MKNEAEVTTEELARIDRQRHREGGGPAFPQPRGGGYDCPHLGMTLRDYFAAKAMVGIAQALAQGIRPSDVPHMANDAYFLADAMLAARDKKPE